MTFATQTAAGYYKDGCRSRGGGWRVDEDEGVVRCLHRESADERADRVGRDVHFADQARPSRRTARAVSLLTIGDSATIADVNVRSTSPTRGSATSTSTCKRGRHGDRVDEPKTVARRRTWSTPCSTTRRARRWGAGKGPFTGSFKPITRCRPSTARTSRARGKLWVEDRPASTVGRWRTGP